MNDNYRKQLISFLLTVTTFSTLFFTFNSYFNTDLFGNLFKKSLTTAIDFENLEINLFEEPVFQSKSSLDQQFSLSSELTDYYMPRFYNRPTLDLPTKESKVNQTPLIENIGVADFSWRLNGLQKILFQGDEPFTGLYKINNQVTYFKSGLQQITSSTEILRKLVDNLFVYNDFPFYLSKSDHRYLFSLKPIEYGILIKTDNLAIYSDPPGLSTARLVSNTDRLFDSPMEVTQEVTNQYGTWLHVYFGYDEVGWIKKDQTYTNYVLTYYSERALLDDVQSTLETYMEYVSATTGASFVNSEHLTQVSVNNQIFFPASTQKIYVLGKIFDLYKSGDLTSESLVILSDENRVPGAGIIQDEPNGSQYTVDYLMDLVSLYSDNTAANMLIEVAGEGEWITPYVHHFGLKDTFVDGKYYHGATNRRFQTSPSDAAKYFALIARNELNGEPWDRQLVQKLMANPYHYLSSYIPYYVTSWNKTGVGSTEQNDVSAFETEYGTYTLAVYTENPYNYDAIPDQLGILSKAVYDVYINHRLLLWESVNDPQAYMAEREEEMAFKLNQSSSEELEALEVE